MEIPIEMIMLYQYTCKNMGINCMFVAKSETVEEVVKLAMAHVLKQHRENFNNIESDEETKRMEEALMHSTRVVVS
jgi:predicted small metal-binding protein